MLQTIVNAWKIADLRKKIIFTANPEDGHTFIGFYNGEGASATKLTSTYATLSGTKATFADYSQLKAFSSSGVIYARFVPTNAKGYSQLTVQNNGASSTCGTITIKGYQYSTPT